MAFDPAHALEFSRLSQASYDANVDSRVLARLTKAASADIVWRHRPRCFRFSEYDVNGFFGVDSKGSAYLVFSGTRPLSIGNMEADLDLEEATLHGYDDEQGATACRGFVGAWESARETLFANYLRPYQKDFETLYIMGHSLGGALALLAGASICREADVLCENVQVFTVGAPRVGSAALARSICEAMGGTSHIMNVCNVDDPIPRLPYDIGLHREFVNPGRFVFVAGGERQGNRAAAAAVVPAWWEDPDDSPNGSLQTFSPLTMLEAHGLDQYTNILGALPEKPVESWEALVDVDRRADQGNSIIPDITPDDVQNLGKRIVLGLKHACVVV